MLKYLLEKEFKTVVRDIFMIRLIVVFPIFVMTILPWAATLEVKNVKLTIVDHDNSSFSRRLASKAAASSWFIYDGTFFSYEEAMQRLEAGDTDMIMEIPSDFEKQLITGGLASVMIAANTVNGTKGALGSGYLSTIVSDFSEELRTERGLSVRAENLLVEVVPQYRFNQRLNYQVFMVPALLVILLTISCGFLPAQNIVSEKEIGTIEQMNVTPVGKFQFILAKLIPYWIIGFITMTIGFLVGFAEYELAVSGSVLTIYLAAALFVLAISGFGLIVSNAAETLQQAMYLMLFFIIIFILMSGLFTPVSSMPRWARIVSACDPLSYFITIMRAVYLKGSTIADLWKELWALVGFAVIFNLWAVLTYSKRG